MILGFKVAMQPGCIGNRSLQRLRKLMLASSADPMLGAAEGAGALQILLGEPSPYAGVYDFARTALNGGPLCVVPPRLSLSQDGARLQALPGLWAFDPEAGDLQIVGQWLRSGALLDRQPGLSLTVQDADGGQELHYVETALQSGREGLSRSDGITLPEAVLHPIAVTPPQPLDLTRGEAVQIDVSAAFASAYGPLSFALETGSDLPEGIVFTPPMLQIAANAMLEGTISIAILATDAKGQMATAEFELIAQIPATGLVVDSDPDATLSVGGVQAEGGTITVTYTAPPEYEGSYSFEYPDMADGPHVLKSGSVTGKVAHGATLTARPALLVNDPDAAGTMTVASRWLRDGVATGITGASYRLDSTTDAGHALRLETAATDGKGIRIDLSAPVNIPSDMKPVDSFTSGSFSAGYESGETWTVTNGGGPIVLSGALSSYNVGIVRRGAAMRGANQFVEGDFAYPAMPINTTSGAWGTGPALCIQTSGANCYGVMVHAHGRKIRLLKQVNGVNTTLHEGVVPADWIESGDLFAVRLEKEGARLRLYVEGNPIIDVTDTSFSDGGIGAFSLISVGTNPAFTRFDNFNGGSFVP